MEKTSFLKKQKSVMKKTIDFLLVKFIVTAIVTVLDTLFAVIGFSPSTMGICGMIFCVIVYITCMNETNDAFLSVFKWNASNDSFIAFSLIIIFLRSLSLLFLQGANTEIFSPILFLSVTVSIGVKRNFAIGIAKNIELLKESDAYLVGSFRDKDGKKYCDAEISEEFPDIVAKSYVIDPSERRGRRFVPIIYAAILVLSLVIMYVRGLSMFFTAAAAMSVIAASLTGEMAFVLPYNTLQSRMRKKGMIFLGYTSIAALKDVSAVVIEDKELFPEENTNVKKLTIKSTKTDVTIRYIDRILKEIDSPAKHVFEGLEALENEIPLSVEEVKYVKDQGVRAIINEDKVFFGSRNLLLANNIEPYSQEKEASLLEDDSVMLYLAVNGELSAAILFEYRYNEELKEKFDEIPELEFIIKTRDVAIDQTLMKKDFGIKKSKIFVTGEEEFEFFEDYEKKLRSGNAKVAMITTSGASELPRMVLLAKDMADVFRFTIRSKHVGICLGILCCFAALLLSPASLNMGWLLLYNLIWLLPIIILSSYRRK